MDKLLIIREYERIFESGCPYFDELGKFVEASEYLTLGWQRNRGAYVQAKNYVGVICLPSGFQIEILPKLDASEENLRELVVKMLRSLKNFSGKKFLNADLDTARLPLYEIFIRVYLEMILDLVKRGLKSSYIVHEENLNFFKGKLLVGRHVRKNFAHREKFFVAFDEYNIDRPEHRLIKSTLLKLLHTTRDQKNFRLANRLLTDFDSVEQSFNYRKDFSEVTIDRQNHEYKAVMAWTKKFLAGESFTSFVGKMNVTALLFDMNKLFEAYVANYVRKIFSNRFIVKIQAREKFLFDESREFVLKPDILLEDKNSCEKIILDTKWKFEPSTGDMYQMFAYAKRYGAKKVFLLCPMTKTFQRCISYRSTVDNLSVTIFFVNLFKVKRA